MSEVAEWFAALAEADWRSAEQVEDAVDALAMIGPTLGDHWSTGSKVRNSTT
ncbi:hypothetical protein ACFCZ1_06845 [Streptomyces sp. NPDC056224]|uniref:hypothetical protein n=1 Tax=Streptomyces sp. NPDC056224 TaxID=3345750 RepID=UPI0035D8F471